MAERAEFVKSATTTTAVSKSQREIMDILERYNASGFGFRKRGTVVSVTFHLPRKGGGDDHEVEIPVDLERVRDRLNSPALSKRRASHKQAQSVASEQVERVAWRLLVLWLDAALAAVALGAQTMEEAFFAHLVVTDSEGNRGRAADYFATLEKLGRGTVPALQSGAWTEVAANRRLGAGG